MTDSNYPLCRLDALIRTALMMVQDMNSKHSSDEFTVMTQKLEAALRVLESYRNKHRCVDGRKQNS